MGFALLDDKVPPVGSTLMVLFNPHNPAQAKRDSFKDLWSGSALCCAIGATLLLLGLFLWLLSR